MTTTVDRNGSAHRPAGAPASTGGQFAEKRSARHHEALSADLGGAAESWQAELAVTGGAYLQHDDIPEKFRHACVGISIQQDADGGYTGHARVEIDRTTLPKAWRRGRMDELPYIARELNIEIHEGSKEPYLELAVPIDLGTEAPADVEQIGKRADEQGVHARTVWLLGNGLGAAMADWDAKGSITALGPGHRDEPAGRWGGSDPSPEPVDDESSQKRQKDKDVQRVREASFALAALVRSSRGTKKLAEAAIEDLKDYADFLFGD